MNTKKRMNTRKLLSEVLSFLPNDLIYAISKFCNKFVYYYEVRQYILKVKTYNIYNFRKKFITQRFHY